MRTTLVTVLAGVACCIFLGGCSGSDDELNHDPGFGVRSDGENSSSAAGDPGDGEPPLITRLAIEPRSPVSREPVRAVLEVDGHWNSMEYVWDLNGQRFGKNSAEVMLPVISTGDTISVRVVPSKNGVASEAKVAHLLVRNQRPMLMGVAIVAVPDGSELNENGELWQASAKIEDPDGDEVDVEYRWYVNGVLSDSEGEFFPAERLSRGDKLEVRVRAHDGRSWSSVVRSGEIEVGNAPPAIVSLPPRPDKDGGFRYSIQVEDPDGDHNFRFKLVEAPDGMEIDSVDGVVTWTPTLSQAGRHDVEVVVTDEAGAEARQEFSIALTKQTESSFPASPR